MPTTAPYGSWASPITTEVLLAKSVSLVDIVIGQTDVWWSEGRPEEAGRQQIVRHRPDGSMVDVLADGYSARTRVHEYGGGAWWLRANDVIFANWSDQRLYLLNEGHAEPVALTPEPAQPHADRYADGRVSPNGQWFICVRERHIDDDVKNEIVAVPLHRPGDEPTVLVSGPDFVAAPRMYADRLCWFQWNHPNMPWDGTQLCVASVHMNDAISLDAIHVVAGGDDESITQPEWSAAGDLLFLSDRSDWWNLYSYTNAQIEQLLQGTAITGEPKNLAPIDAEIGIPHWVFDASRYAQLADGRIAVAYFKGGIDHLGIIENGAVRPIDTEWTAFQSLRPFGNGFAVLAASPISETVVAVVDPDGAFSVLRPPRSLDIDTSFFSTPEPVTFATSGDRFAHALFYKATNPNFVAPENEKAPLIVLSHGGPTSAARPQLSLAVQFWTSRGFGVVDVNYGGSTGYGRSYRRRLNGEWGIVDVDDCVAVTRLLVDRGDADRDRLIIRGGSAGGYTTLCALTFRDVFAAGCSLYGVADLEALARDTHKFEARYLDTLVGPYPQRRSLYVERSPIHHTYDLECPLIILQGEDDEIVPVNQAEMMVEALEDNGVPWAYLVFSGEQHGFRKAETIKRAIEAEAYFYSQILGFTLADEVEPVEIANL
ncbi:MAG: hypothetical protein RLZZ31_1310 [Actinomycetota bacterium]